MSKAISTTAIAAVMFAVACQVHASGSSYSDLQAWLAQYEQAPADGLAPGTYGHDKLADLTPYLAPGFIDHFDFAELEFEIFETQHYLPHRWYQEATARHVDQATIGDDGMLEGYIAGRPFSNEAIDAASLEQTGLMVAWNRIHRWQYYGYRLNETIMAYLVPTPDGAAGELLDGMEGGGHVDRHLSMTYHRVYLSKLSNLPDQGYRMDVAGSDELLYKEHMELLSPFDVAGMQFVIERPLDQRLGDQVNSYLPSERRVRRLSAKERADSFMGTVWTMDDFEGFSGLVTDNTWTLIGRKVAPQVVNSKHEHARYHGPMSIIPLDRWQLRPCYVVEAIPKWEGHRYGRRVMFIDQETYTIGLTLIFDRSDALVKVFQIVHASSDDLVDPEPSLTIPRWRSSIGIDLKDGTATIARAMKPTEFVTMKPSKVRQLFSISNLTSGR